MLSAVAEGMHSRLFGHTSEQLSLSRSRVKLLRRMARAAAMDAYDGSSPTNDDATRGQIYRSLTESVNSIATISFAERLAQLATTMDAVAPDVLANFTPERLSPFLSRVELVATTTFDASLPYLNPRMSPN